jgi:hypothetical protein
MYGEEVAWRLSPWTILRLRALLRLRLFSMLSLESVGKINDIHIFCQQLVQCKGRIAQEPGNTLMLRALIGGQ